MFLRFFWIHSLHSQSVYHSYNSGAQQGLLHETIGESQAGLGLLSGFEHIVRFAISIWMSQWGEGVGQTATKKSRLHAPFTHSLTKNPVGYEGNMSL